MNAFRFRELFAFAVMLALATEFLIPLAYAQNAAEGETAEFSNAASSSPKLSFSPEVKNFDGCYVSDISEADKLRWWSLTSRFQAQEVSGMNLKQLRKNKVGEKPKVVAPEVMAYDLRQAAQLLGMKPEDVAKEVGKDVGEPLTENDILYLQSLKKRPGLFADLVRLTGRAPKAEVEYMPYENYKFTMVGPDGKAVSLKEVLELYPIDKTDCELGSQAIQGKVNYAATLDRDLRIGYEKSQETTAYEGSHWVTGEATYSFGEISGNVVIPEMYKNYVIKLGHWTYLDNIVTAFSGIAAFAGAAKINDEIKLLEGKHTRAREDLAAISHTRPGVLTEEEAAKKVNTLFTEASKTATDTSKKIALKTTEKHFLDSISKILLTRAALTFYFGMGWLGPARFALELSDGYFFRLLPTTDPKLFNQYLHLYANSKPLAEFKKATDFTVVGDIFDFAASHLKMGVPPEAFKVGDLVMTNEAREDERAITKLSLDGNEWRIRTDWPGGAVAGVFEDIRKQKDYSSLTLSTRNLGISARLNRRMLDPNIYRALSTVAPFLAARLIFKEAVPSSLLTFGQLMIYDMVVHTFVNPHEWSAGDTCDQQLLDKYLFWYKAWVAAGWAEIIAGAIVAPQIRSLSILWEAQEEIKGAKKAFVNLVKTLQNFPAFARVLPNSLLLVDPTILGKIIMANKGFEYLGSCKDTAYTIVAYQKLEKGKRPSAYNATIEKTGLSKVIDQLNLGSLLKSVGEKINEAQLKEVMSFKSAHKGQNGLVSASELIYLYVDPDSTTAWRDVYSNLTKCLRETFVGRDGTAWIRDRDGWKLVNTTTGDKIDSFTGDDWSDRVLFSQIHPGLSRALAPNKVITTPPLETCGSGVVLQISGDGLITSTCPACVAGAVNEVTGITSDLGAALGRIVDVSTDEFSGTIRGGVARFYRTVKKEKAEAGTEYFLEGATIQILGDRTVEIVGKTGKVKELGKLTSILTEYGHLEVVPSSGQLKILVKTLAFAAPGNIQNVVPGSNPWALFTINNVNPQGDPKYAEELKKALNKIQAGVGFQSFETEKMRYDLLRDAQGNPVLRATNKETGESKDYKLTGVVRKEGDDIIVPTDRGDFRFTIDTKGNEPRISVTGPDGIKEVLAAILAARGPDGILAFDPKTGNWYAYNAQDLPLNPNFAKNGISWFGGPDGAKGLPTENMFAIPRVRREAAISPLGPFAFPSFAEGLLGAVMVAFILAGVLAVRAKATAAARRRRCE